MSISRQRIEAEIKRQEEGLEAAQRTLRWHIEQERRLNGLLHEIAGRLQALKGLLKGGDERVEPVRALRKDGEDQGAAGREVPLMRGGVDGETA